VNTEEGWEEESRRGVMDLENLGKPMRSWKIDLNDGKRDST